jgi:autotransporter-associated beta strand protein
VGAIFFAGGTLQYSPNNQYDYSGRLSTTAGQPVSIDTAGQPVLFMTPLTSSGGSLTVTDSVGSGVLTLYAAETYSGNTVIHGGTLALGSGASLANSSSIAIAPAAILDVTGLSSYTLGTAASLTASGTASKPAVINGYSGESISLGSSQIVLNYDGVDPALTISQGTLSLNGNAFTINGLPLPSGNYVVATQANGTISSSGAYTVNGTAIGGSQASIAVTGGQVVLTVKAAAPSPTLYVSVSGNTLNFSWSPSQLGSTLQSNSISLAGTNDWFNIAGSASVTNVGVSINKGSPAVFFRLLAP